MQRVALRDVDLASFRAAIGPEGCADGAIAVQRGAVVQMAWEASQQLLTGTVRESARDGQGRGDQDGVRLVPRVPGVPAAVPRGLLQLRQGHQLRARRRARARRDRRDAAARDHGGRARGPPLRAALGAVARLAARHPAGPRPRPRPATSPRTRRSRSSCPWCSTRRSRSATPATPPTTGGTSRPPRTPPASSSCRPGWCSRAASAAGSRATCPGPGSTTCCCAMSSRPRTSACCTSSTPCTGPARRRSTPVTTAYASPGYGDQKYLDLSACESRQLWPVLEQAHAVGLPFVYRGKQGTVPPPGTAELCLDVTTDGTTLLIAPVIKTADSADAVPLRFIGTEGHGVIYADREQAAQRRARPVPARPADPSGARAAAAARPRGRAAGRSRRPGRPRSCPGTTRGCAARPP